MEDQKEVWTVKEVASYIAKSEQTVRKMCKRGDLPHKKVGRHLYFTKSIIRKMFIL